MPKKKADELQNQSSALPADNGGTPNPDNRTFEEQLARLQDITGQLERGDLSLERSLELYGEGVELSRACRARLENARHTVQIYTEDGLTGFGPLDAEE